MEPVDLDITPTPPVFIPKKLSKEAYLAYFQNNKNYASLISDTDMDSHKQRFNFVAALLGSTWLIYKGMYKQFFIYISAGTGLLLLSALILLVLKSNSIELTKTQFIALFFVILIIMKSALGFMANKIYLKKARTEILDLVNSRIPEDHFSGAVKEAGKGKLLLTLAYMTLAPYAVKLIGIFLS